MTVKLAIEFGEMTIDEESKIPILPVNVFCIGEDGTKTLMRTNYLCPFRAYSFQVCGNLNGEGDNGSSSVIGLGNCLTSKSYDGLAFRSNYNSDGIAKELLRGQISLAMNQFYGKSISDARYMFKNCNDVDDITISNFPKMRGPLGGGEIDHFIDACVEWIKSFM